MSFETVTGTSRHELAVTGSLFRVELFQLSRDAYDQERFQRRATIRAFDRAIWFLTPEDVILTKLRWSRLKDRQDIANVLAATHETQATLDEIRASLSPMGNEAEEV